MKLKWGFLVSERVAAMADHICMTIDGVCATCRASLWTGQIPVQAEPLTVSRSAAR